MFPFLPLFAVDSEINFAISMTGLGLLIPILVRLLKLRDEHMGLLKDVSELKQQNTILWHAHMSRGRLEGEKTGHMQFTGTSRSITHDSFRLSLEARDKFIPINESLHHLAASMPNADDQMLSMVIEKQLGNWIVDNVCRPLGVDKFSCLVMALAIARSRDSVMVYPPLMSPRENSNE